LINTIIKNMRIIKGRFSAILFLLLFLSCGGSNMGRKEAARGMFYPYDKNEILNLINKFLKEAKIPKIKGEIVGGIVPHAGYIYSGPVAGYVYKAIEGRKFDTVILIGPSHHVGFKGCAIDINDYWNSPLGRVNLDKDLIKKLIDGKRIFFDEVPHLKEHSLEVQIPFLQRVLKNGFKIVPIVMGQDTDSWVYLSKKLYDILEKEKKKILILASTDLSHYYDYRKASSMDKKLIEYIKRMDLDGLIKALNNGEVEMCGARSVLTLIKLMKDTKAKPLFLKYLNSGDTAGDKSRVVGYGAFVFVKGGDMLTDEDKKTLLKIARKTLEEYLKTGKVPDFEIKSENLKRIQGAFVTLHKKGRLRGCIGNIIGRKPLWETVRDMAIESAVGDPRFPNVKYEELKDIDIEISVLSPLKRVSSPDEIVLGKHGVLVRKGFNQGVYLPQVATETGWSKEEFLSSLCYHKAGLDPLAWKDKDTELYVFEAIVFDEKEFGLR